MSKKNSTKRSNSHPQRQGAQQFRVIAGQWRGRRFDFPDRPGLRPTGDRTRETLFNWLQTAIHGSRCLDLFAGSGALGFEAASRGAAEVHMIETDAQAADNLRRIHDRLSGSGSSRAVEIHQVDSMQLLQQGPSQSLPAADIIFVDPPYAAELQLAVLASLKQRGWLNSQALVYIEAPFDSAGELGDWVPQPWRIIREKRAGAVSYGLLQLDEAEVQAIDPLGVKMRSQPDI